ncbi:hypothetical protein AB0B79_28650 [Streptomyces sp. NPDC039022]|uniref:hypothetical protein n=1 Tax=Streptomyces sp. NPDC039022 TaxID=3157091 RepID=UPI0033D8AD80
MDKRSETPEQRGSAVPRDLPDQQADPHGGTPDPWEGRTPDGEDDGDDGSEHTDVPDTDVSGTGRRGAAHDRDTQAEDPTPDEPAD